MSDQEDVNSLPDYRDSDHQSAYVYIPLDAADDGPPRPSKRRKIGKRKGSIEEQSTLSTLGFSALLRGKESLDSIQRRFELYERAWAQTEAHIESILNEANEDTLRDVTAFIQEPSKESSNATNETGETIATGFVVTGPNIASQGLLFQQISSHLRDQINGPVVVLRSGDAPNLKAVLKKVIRDATNQKAIFDDEDEVASGPSGLKLLNYDLELLHSFVRAHRSEAVVIAFQDSEAFDTALIAALIALFSSWKNRIPFALLFGIATSLDLFQERLPRTATRSLNGAQFDVEHTSSLVERIFKKVLAGAQAPLLLSTSLITNMMERQQEHAQSVQSFTAALKYAYMCHFSSNALSILTPVSGASQALDILQPEHYEAVRTLSSFKTHVKTLLDTNDRSRFYGLLTDGNAALREEIGISLSKRPILKFLRVMFLVANLLPEPASSIDLYVKTFDGSLGESDFVSRILDSTKRMLPEDLVHFLQNVQDTVYQGSLELELSGWAAEDEIFIQEISDLQSEASNLVEEALTTEKPIRSSYAIRSQGVRTTVIAQRVQLSYEESTLSQQDKQYTVLVDRVNELLKEYFSAGNPQDTFLHELWLYDDISPYRKVFTPKPRAAIERAFSTPYDYLECECCDPVEGLSSTHPATTILYQMYLETGSLINVFDLWSAFFEMVSGGDEQKIDERDALVLFYRALADLKSLGMIKQSKKKADHLAKTTWKGL